MPLRLRSLSATPTHRLCSEFDSTKGILARVRDRLRVELTVAVQVEDEDEYIAGVVSFVSPSQRFSLVTDPDNSIETSIGPKNLNDSVSEGAAPPHARFYRRPTAKASCAARAYTLWMNWETPGRIGQHLRTL